MSNESCQMWDRGLDSGGYGKARLGERGRDGRRATVLVHRWAWQQAHGPIPPGMVVMHTCDNRACYKIEHLRLGTQADNQADMVLKNRQAQGQSAARAKLNAVQVGEIRARLARGETQKSVAERFSIHQTTVSQIKRSFTWKCV